MLKVSALCALVCLVAVTTARADSPSSSEWSFAVTPYLWLPKADGSLNYSGSGGGADADLQNNSFLDYLDSMFMLGGEVKKDRWVALTDFVYADFGNTAGHAHAQTDTSLIGKAWTLLGGRRMLEGPVDVDLLGGVRYFGLMASTDWQVSTPLVPSGTASDSTDVWDGLFALNGRVHLGKCRVFLPYYVDVGAGQSKLTWQASGGAGYAFKWLDLSLTYRTIYYDERNDGLMDQLSFTGPAAALSFRF